MKTDVVFRRILAVIIDGILLFIVSGIILVLLELIGLDVWDVDSNDFSVSATATFGGAIVSGLLSLAYKVFMEATRNGQTLGKMALSIRAVNENSGATISTEQAIIRGLFWQVPFTLSGLGSEFGLLGLIGTFWLIAGLIALIVSPLRQRLGDRFAHTIVVRDEPTLAAHMSFGQGNATGSAASLGSSTVQTPASTISTQGEVWMTCGYCGSRFPQTRAHQGVWEGRSVLLCPNCGAPLDDSAKIDH